MSNFYSHQKKFLGELINQAMSTPEHGANILIPDLQRPFVWKPTQVTLLMDSIIRGWPFGTLLLWKLKDSDLPRFPHRCFYRTVNRTDEENGNLVDMQQPPAEYLMVLDGQQRLQSLLLAVGGDEWGFKLKDTDWALELHSRKTRQTSYPHWSMGSLCFDTAAFLEEYKLNGGKLLALDFTKVLRWMVTKPVGGQSTHSKPDSYEESLLRTFDPANDGRYIRFSRIWHAVKEDAQLKEKDFRLRLQELLKDWKVGASNQAELIDPLAELMTTIRDIKLSEVSFLQVNNYSEIWSQDEYNDAIVNIFTRLNTAGRTLTREEITLAWLKTGWPDAGKSFGELKDKLEETGLPIGIDELVGLVSFLWAVHKHNGKLLQNRDLLDQKIIQPMAKDLSENWRQVQDAILSSMELLAERGLKYGNSHHYTSLYSLVVIWALNYMGDVWKAGNQQKGIAKDDFEMKLRKNIDVFLDRWMFGSQWAGRWSVGLVKNVEGYASLLAKVCGDVQKLNDPDAVVRILQDTAKTLLDGIIPDAYAGIDTVSASSKNRVSVYRNFLWVWHRLDGNRWEMSKIALKTKRRNATSADVDHCVAYGLWESRINAEWKGQDLNEKAELVSLVNKLGNCALLEKTFNIIKSKKQLADFLPEIHEFRAGLNPQEWAQKLSLPDVIINAASSPLSGIQKEIEARDVLLRDELKKFIKGEKTRTDI